MKKKIYTLLLFVVFAFTLTGCQPKPTEIASQFLAAINDQDIETSLSLLSDSAQIKIGDSESYQGKEAIQNYLENAFLLNIKIEADTAQSDGDTVSEDITLTSDYWKFIGTNPMEGTLSITVQDGSITNIDISFSSVSLTKLEDSSATTTSDLIGVWTVQTQESGTVEGVPDQWFLQFHADSKARWAESADDLALPVDDSHLGAWITWSYEGVLLIVQNEGPSSEFYCQPEDVGLYLVRQTYDKWNDETQIGFKLVKDPCAFRMVNFPRFGATWKPYIP